MNSVSWYFIGQRVLLNKSLQYYSKFEDNHPPIDTLFTYLNYKSPGDSIAFSSISSIKKSEREYFYQLLKSISKANHIEFQDTTGFLFQSLGEGNYNFLIHFEYPYPFYTEIEIGEVNTREEFYMVASYTPEYFWFFGWWLMEDDEIFFGC